MDSSADPRQRHTRERILLWWPPASGQVLGTATTTWSLFLTTSWGQPTSTAGSFHVYGVAELTQPPTRCWWSGCTGGVQAWLDMLHARLEQGSDSHPPSETEIQMVLSSALPALAQSPPVGGVSGSTMSRNGAIREALLAGSSRCAGVGCSAKDQPGASFISACSVAAVSSELTL